MLLLVEFHGNITTNDKDGGRVVLFHVILNPISPGTFEAVNTWGGWIPPPLFFSAVLRDMRPKIGRDVNYHVNNETESSKSNYRCRCCC